MRKGAALVVLNAVDAKSLVLFILVLVVCVLFLANGAYASVRSRRIELGVLACLGWGRAALFRLVLGELAVGLATGVLGAALAETLALACGCDCPGGRRFSCPDRARARVCRRTSARVRGDAGASPRCGVPGAWRRRATARFSTFQASRVPTCGDAQCGWSPVRLVCSSVSRRSRSCSRSNSAFQGEVVGTALGNLVSVQVRGVDLIAAVLALLLGAFSVADVLAVNLRDRVGEQAILAACGWRASTLFRLAFTEGMAVGVLGALPAAASASA